MLSEIISSLRDRLFNTSTLAQESVRNGQGSQSFFQGAVADNIPAFLLNNNFISSLISNGTQASDVNPGDDVFEGGVGDDTLFGGAGNDTLLGGAGDDTLEGESGNDILEGGAGADTLVGGTGNDFIQGGGGSDSTDGGEGIDTVSFADIGSAVTVDLEAGTAEYIAPNGATIVDQVSNFENVLGSSNDDIITGDNGDNVLTGGIGNDELNGGEGSDTADFSDIDVPVNVTLDAAGNGSAIRETGFSVSVEDVIVDTPIQGPPLTQIENAADFVTEAFNGNLYFNIHTADFPGGEIRGQLFLVEGSDTRDANGIGSFTVAGQLNAAQEPGPLSDSAATGFGSVTVTIGHEGIVTYSSLLSVDGIAESDLLTPISGVVSAIHLHNAPAGINGGVAQDTLVDAGAIIDAVTPSGVSGLDVIDEVIETDTLTGIENVIGSNDGDSIIASGGAANTLSGLAGDDFLAGGGGTDIIDGGEGIDTNSFFNINGALELENEDALEDGGVVVTLNADGTGTSNYVVGGIVNGVEQGPNIFEEFTGIENIEGTNNNDSIIASGNAANTLSGLAGDDFLAGGGGNDTLFGGAGDDFIQGGGGSDFTDGGEGIDTVSFADIGNGVTVNLEGQSAEYLAPNGNLVVDDVNNFENVLGSSNDDIITGDDGDNVLTGGLGNDELNGGDGIDTADFSDLDVDIDVQVDANGDAIVTRETGFSVSVDNVAVNTPVQGPPLTQIANAADFADEAVAGNLYYNIHTSDFPAGEIRGQLFVVEGGDVIEGDIRTITLAGNLDSSQEPGPTSDSEATGTASLVITQNLLTGEVTYSSELSVVGLEESDLLTPIPGVVSAIHLHNAPAGINGGVAQDTLVDAGAIIDAEVPSGVSGLDVIDEVIETDTLTSIENIIDADGNLIAVADLIDGLELAGGATGDLLEGGAGADTLVGAAGADTLVGAAGADTLEGGSGRDLLLGGDGDDTLEGGSGNDILIGGAGSDSLFGGTGNDVIAGGSGDNILSGGLGADAFIFSADGGVDTVTDFENGADSLDVSDLGPDFDLATAIEGAQQDGLDTVVNLSENDALRLQDFDLGDLDEADFVVAVQPTPEAEVAAPVEAFAPTNNFDGDEFTS